MAVYQSEFQGAVIDARLAAVATMQTAISNLETAVAAKYSKPASGIPETDLDAAVRSALALARTAVQSLSDYYTKAQVDDITAAIAASVDSTSGVVVTSLPSAGAGTLGKMYYVGPDANGFYDRYVTSYDGSTYTWLALGNTEVDMTQYATVEQLNQLDQKVTKITGGNETPTIIWEDGMIYNGPGVSSNAAYKRSNPIRVYPGDAVSFTGGSESSAIDVDAIAKYQNGAYSALLYYATHAQEVVTWTATEECDIVISTQKTLFSGSVTIARQGELPKIVEEIAEIIEVDQEQTADISELKENSFEKVCVSSNIFNKAAVTHGYYVAYYDGDLRALDGFWTSDFIEIKPNTYYIMSRQQQLAFYNENKGYISGIATPSGAFQSPATAKYIRICGDETLLNVWALYEGQSLPSYQPYAEGYKDFYINEQNIIQSEAVRITATRNAADFNSIREIINSITDASESKRYVIFVPNGRWFECDLQGKPFVSIVGEDRIKTVIYCDGTSDKVTPNDYFFAGYRGVPLNTIPQGNKHVFFAVNDLDVRNLTIEGNDIKYCAHMDKDGWQSVSFDNCHFIAKENVNCPVGIGIRGGQTISVKNSTLERTITGNYGFIAHNWNNQAGPSFLTFESCYFKRCGFALIDELGSEQDDDWKILNCYSDVGGEVRWMVDYDENGKTYWVNPATGQKETDPTAVPYCIHLNCLGSNVEKVFKSKFASTNTIARPDCAKYTMTDYFAAMPSSGHPAGKVIRGYQAGQDYIEGVSLPVLGVIDSVVDGLAYMAKKNVSILYANLYGENITNGALVYVRSDGFLTTVVTGDPVGVVSEDFYVLGKVIHLF